MNNYKKTMTVKVTVKNNYGQKAVYPACQTAKLFARLAGTTTLTDQSLFLINKLGYEIVETGGMLVVASC